MINNYISINLKYMLSQQKSNMDDFGHQFDLNRGMISQYVRMIATPKLETIQKICVHYAITIDDFVNSDLNESKSKIAMLSRHNDDIKSSSEEISSKYLELMERVLIDKDATIQYLKRALLEKIEIIKNTVDKKDSDCS
jgi:transcriptional regulator with XRE-family HTH domain